MNYFDYAASAPIYPEVLEVLSKTLQEDFANPSAQHILGNNLYLRMEEYRSSFLKILDAKKNDHFIFTASATESNNTIIKGLKLRQSDVVLFSRADHPSVTASVDSLSVTAKEIPHNNNGTINLEKFFRLLDSNVKLVVVSHVNNQSGIINDIGKISKMVREKTSAHFHVDAVQSFGKIAFTLTNEIDSMSVTSHKIGGPKGVAGLFLKSKVSMAPLLSGGGQENGFRSGSVPFPLIAGFYEAMKISTNDKEAVFRASHFNELMRAELKKEIPEAIFPFSDTSPFIISLILPGISSDIILRHLEMRDIYISSTAACSAKKTGFNPSLFATGIEEKHHKNFLRISTGNLTKEDEVKKLIVGFASVWKDIKHMRGR